MPRKPRAIYVFVEPQITPGSQVPGIQAWKLEIPDGSTPEDTLRDNASLFPTGQIQTVTDTKITAYSTQPSISEVDAR